MGSSVLGSELARAGLESRGLGLRLLALRPAGGSVFVRVDCLRAFGRFDVLEPLALRLGLAAASPPPAPRSSLREVPQELTGDCRGLSADLPG